VFLLGIILEQYVEAAATSKKEVAHSGVAYVRFQILPMVALLLFLIYEVTVLMVSLPVHRTPPIGRFARHFFTEDVWCIARREAEVLTAAVWIGSAFICGKVRFMHVLPAGVAAIAPLTKLQHGYAGLQCLREFVAAFASLPRLCVQVTRRNVRRVVDPLDGLTHVMVAAAAVVLCIAFRPRWPVILLFLSHSVVLALGLVERAVFRRLAWRDGRVWWFASLVAMEATNLTLDCQWLTALLLLGALCAMKRAFDQPMRSTSSLIAGWCLVLLLAEATGLLVRELRGPLDVEAQPTPLAIMFSKAMSCVWFGLFGGLACAVNSRRCARYYRSWQRRHATFVLCAPPSDPRRGEFCV